jgi:serine/threonine-protein kinase SRK2
METSPGAVIAGGAQEGEQQPLPDPLAGHPRYRKVRDLNWGTSGFVVLAVDMTTGQQLAIKFISRGRQHVDVNMKEISRELLNQRMCALHPNIVQLREVFLTADYLAVAMEYADGGDLSEHIDQQYQKGIDYMSEDDARWIFQQLIVAVDYCHRLGIANRDIKLDNMLLHGPWPRPQLKLCDFGFSKNEVVQSVSKSTCGTPEYMAPEVLFEMKYNGQDADVWSCGVSLYVMLTGVFPFSRPTDEAEAESAGGSTRVMRHMFRPNPAERCTTEDIMAHPWFTRNLPPELGSLNDRLLAARAAEHAECRRSLSELDRFTGPLPAQPGTAAAAADAVHNPYSAANRRGHR